MSSRECPVCHRYCARRCRYCGYVRPVTRRPDHHRKVVMGIRLGPTGTREFKAMSSRKAAQVLGGQKGGLRSAALGVAHCWTADTAREAAIKSWTKRRKVSKRIGVRVGMKANRRKGLWREPLRAYYAENETRGIRYQSDNHRWVRLSPGPVRGISERAALIALGHLSSPRGYIPDSIMATPRTGKSREKTKR